MFAMLWSILGALAIGWLLTLVGADTAAIDVFQPLVPVLLTIQHYYVAFGILGLILGIPATLKRR